MQFFIIYLVRRARAFRFVEPVLFGFWPCQLWVKVMRAGRGFLFESARCAAERWIVIESEVVAGGFSTVSGRHCICLPAGLIACFYIDLRLYSLCWLVCIIDCIVGEPVRRCLGSMC